MGSQAGSPGSLGWKVGGRKLLLHSRQIKAGAFFGAAHKQVAVAQRRRAPALAGDGLEPGDFLISVRDSLYYNQLAVIGQGQEVFAGQYDLARAKAWLFPLDGAGLQVHALQWAGPEPLEADHAIKEALFLHGRAPQAGYVFVAFHAPQFFSLEPTVIAHDLAGRAAYLVAGRAEDDVPQIGRASCR